VVNLETANRVPVLMAKRWTGERSWEVSIAQNLTWIVTDLRTGQVRAVCPLPLDKRRMATPKPSRTPPPPSAANRSAVTYGIERMNLPAVFGKEWPSGRYAATLAIHDLLSNTVLFKTTPLRRPPEEVIQPPSPFVEATPGPSPGANPGVLFSVRALAGGPVILRGTVSIPRDEVVLVKSSAGPGLLLPATIILLKLDSTTPIQIDITIPAAVQDGLVATRFSMSLRDVPQGQGLAGEYQAYVVMGQSVAGPQVLKID